MSKTEKLFIYRKFKKMYRIVCVKSTKLLALQITFETYGKGYFQIR